MAGKQWNGVDRSNFVWHPTIDESRCTNCGLCMLSCGSGVFGWSRSKNKYVVKSPGSCAVGCTTCGKVCPEDAITFPDTPKHFVKAAIAKYKIYPAVTDALKVRLEKYPDHIVQNSKIGKGAN